MLASMTASPRSDFTAGLPVTLPVPGCGSAIDRKHRESGRDRVSHEQPLVRLNRDLDRGRLTLAVLGQ
jgi:hypothetical protein